MRRTLIWVAVILVLAGASVGGAYYYNTNLKSLGIESSIYGGKNPEPGTYTPSPLEPPVTGPKTSPYTGYVKVLALTDHSITVQTDDAVATSSTTFEFAPNMAVYSVVASGQTGRGLSDIAVGGKVNVFRYSKDQTKAGAIAFERAATFVVSQADAEKSVSGKITALTATSVTITPTDDKAAVTIALDASTKIATTVLSGTKGRDLAVGDMAVASGLTTSGGVITAKMILLGVR